LIKPNKEMEPTMTKINKEWLRRRIETDPDVETEAGLPITKPEVLQALIPGQVEEPAIHRTADFESAGKGLVLATLLRQLRRRDKMEIPQLAVELRVPEDELRAIEGDRDFVPKPRTIHQIAHYYKVSPRALLKLSPASVERDPDLEEVAVRFAASSDGLSKLSRDERKSLNEFIKFLSEYKEHPR
jgi:transcriptional regulator with XRE-family HTH domain